VEQDRNTGGDPFDNAIVGAWLDVVRQHGSPAYHLTSAARIGGRTSVANTGLLVHRSRVPAAGTSRSTMTIAGTAPDRIRGRRALAPV
jgi:hypothetical protein